MGMMKRSGKESKTAIDRDSSCLIDDGGVPLAARMRPRTLEEFIGQPHILGEGKLLRRAIEADRVTSVIFWGPPGTGKTTLARVIANATQSKFETINAVLAGVKDIREVVAGAAERLKKHSFEDSQRTILFVDEVHRFNKAQQDALLPHVENGTITFIGATTENPYFSVIKALVSRSTIFELRSLADDELREILLAALDDCERGYGELNHEVAEDALDHIVQLASGDARNALNALELALVTTPPGDDGVARIGLEVAEESIQQRALLYDKDGDIHYDMISAFIKSLRGTDPDAALYWMARMIRAGEDPLFIARRMVIFASEDIGMADIGAQELREITRGLDDTSRVVFQTQYSSEKKSRGVTTILAVMFGFDRFYLGQIGLGIFKWLTIGGLFVWWFIDIFTAAGRADEFNRNKAREIAISLRPSSESPPDPEGGN